MRSYQHFGPLDGLLLLLLLLLLPFGQANAAKANMGIWDMDDSCTNYPKGGTTGGTDLVSKLQTAFDEALACAQAAKDSIEFVLQKRPDPTVDPDKYIKWIRIADAMVAVLGIAVNPDEVNSLTEQDWKMAHDVYSKTIATLPASENNPAKGFNQELTKTDGGQPLIVCGDEGFKWYGLDDTLPGHDKTMRETPEFSQFFVWGSVGAWVKRNRYTFEKEERAMPIFCSEGTLAVTSFEYNFLVFCPRVFEGEMKTSPTLTELKNGDIIQPRDSIDKHVRTIGYHALHEFMHWFGGLEKNSDGSYDLARVIVIDQPAVTEDGILVYLDPDTGKYIYSVTRKKNLPQVKTYGSQLIFNLATRHKGDQAQFSGPKIATKNADSLAMFAAMMYLDKWKWSNGAIARSPGKVYT